MPNVARPVEYLICLPFKIEVRFIFTKFQRTAFQRNNNVPLGSIGNVDISESSADTRVCIDPESIVCVNGTKFGNGIAREIIIRP